MNPGMSDVVAMAPMALGSIEAPVAITTQQGLAADENPADILSQVVAEVKLRLHFKPRSAGYS